MQFATTMKTLAAILVLSQALVLYTHGLPHVLAPLQYAYAVVAPHSHRLLGVWLVYWVWLLCQTHHCRVPLWGWLVLTLPTVFI